MINCRLIYTHLSIKIKKIMASFIMEWSLAATGLATCVG